MKKIMSLALILSTLVLPHAAKADDDWDFTPIIGSASDSIQQMEWMTIFTGDGSFMVFATVTTVVAGVSVGVTLLHNAYIHSVQVNRGELHLMHQEFLKQDPSNASYVSFFHDLRDSKMSLREVKAKYSINQKTFPATSEVLSAVSQVSRLNRQDKAAHNG